VLGYLLKHAHLALEHRAQAALADIGVPFATSACSGSSQAGKRSHSRKPRPCWASTAPRWSRSSTHSNARESSRAGPQKQDRRRNIIALTDHGWAVFKQAESRYSETERDFTATPGDSGAAGLRQALRTVLSENGHA
jgi:hypothetical protein